VAVVTDSAPSKRTDLARLWGRVDLFCIERGWSAELYVREDAGPNFGRVGVRIDQGAGYFVSAWGDTTEEAVRQITKQLERDGFDA
jgi:hypothetical protein